MAHFYRIKLVLGNYEKESYLFLGSVFLLLVFAALLVLDILSLLRSIVFAFAQLFQRVTVEPEELLRVELGEFRYKVPQIAERDQNKDSV